MSRFFSAILLTVITIVWPRSLFALTDENFDATDYSNAQCVDGTYYCTCTGSSISHSSAATATASANDCDSFCQTMTADSYTYTCTLGDGTANATVSQGNVGSTSSSTTTTTAVDTSEKDDNEAIVPTLNVEIPGFAGFSTPTTAKGYTSVNFLGEYISAAYGWMLGAGTLIAVVMMMLGGLQYVLSRGKEKYISKAKTRITNAITGVVLLFAAYNIAFFINPQILDLGSITLQSVQEIELDASLADDGTGDPNSAEGSGTAGGTATASAGENWKTLPAANKAIVEAAKNDTSLACKIPDLLSSPTGSLPKTGNHHWYDAGRNGNYQKITSLDWGAPWGTAIKAPFAGTVSYAIQKDTNNRCGNRIYLKGPGGIGDITICHAKNFLNANNEYTPNATVAKGDVIGHVGGLCCAGGKAPSGWLTKCQTSGTMCTDPTKNQSCSCQPINMSGNTTGPHVHITFNSGGNILSCLD